MRNCSTSWLCARTARRTPRRSLTRSVRAAGTPSPRPRNGTWRTRHRRSCATVRNTEKKQERSMAENDEQTLVAKIAITRETGGKYPAFSYVIKMIDDASGLLIGEARMDGETFAKILTGHITTVPVSVAGSADRQRY